MDISETVLGTDYLKLGSNLVVESVIDLGSAKKCCLALASYCAVRSAWEAEVTMRSDFGYHDGGLVFNYYYYFFFIFFF